MKIFTSIWMVIVFAVVLTGVRIDNSDTVKILRYKTWDHFQQVHPRQEVSDQIVVVNITESDIKKYGQWPWPRHILGIFHSNLSEAGAILVNYNILFAEQDRMSGTEYLKSMPIINLELREQLGKVLLDTDAVFSAVMKQYGNAVLMMSVKNKKDNTIVRTTQIIQKGDAIPWLYNYAGIVPPHTKVTAGSTAIGVNVTSPEPDAVVRKMPMLIRVGDKIYPSMILENIRLINKSKRIKVISKQHGIDQILVKKDAGIPVNHNAEMYINYAEPTDYTQLTADEVFSNEHKDKLAGKIVVVGLDAAGLSVLKYTPHGLTTDQMITAQSLDTTMTGKYLFRLAQADAYEIVFMAFLLLLLILVLPRTSVLLAVPLLIFIEGGVAYASFVAYANKGFLIDPSFIMLSVFLVWSHSVYNNFATQSRLKQQIKRQFGSYLSPDMVAQLQKDPGLLKLGGDSRELSIMFTDVRGFTAISEHYGRDVQGLTRIMNRYMTAMTREILANKGTIDKYIGDAQMAFWNAPLKDTDHAENSVNTAIKMLESLRQFNEEVIKEGVPAFGMGMGINTAEVVVGNMGSDQRFDYTCLGDGVNLAARLEGQSKTYGVLIVLGPETARQVRNSIDVFELDCIAVKGKKIGVNIYTVAKETEHHRHFLESYYEGDWPEAIKRLDTAVTIHPEMKQYYANMRDRLESGKPADWDGIHKATTK
jgi:adenylate cyclase